jgi:hypothetical protein
MNDARRVKVQKIQRKEAKKFALFFNDIRAYSVVDDNKEIRAVFGYKIGHHQTAECFALRGENMGKFMPEFVRFLLKEIPKQMKINRVWRVTMSVKKGFDAGVRLARILGFCFVADLPRFYDGEDYQLFERVNI